MNAIKRYLKKVDSVDIVIVFAIILYSSILMITLIKWI